VLDGFTPVGWTYTPDPAMPELIYLRIDGTLMNPADPWTSSQVVDKVKKRFAGKHHFKGVDRDNF
jgi:predicted hydrolase (HD superfamily)